jgi:hypothetical protein
MTAWPASSVQSDKLMQIVTVVYGVSLTSAFTKNSDLVLDPFHQNLIQFLCLVCAALLSCYGFFAYVLAVSSDYPYDVRWTVASAKASEALRFATDLVLAVLYVRMLLFAANLKPATANSHQGLSGFFYAIAMTMFWACIVRILRYKSLLRGIPSLLMAAIAVLVACVSEKHQTRIADLVMLGVAIVFILAYIVVNDRLGWCWWKWDVRKGKLPTEGRDKARDALRAAANGMRADSSSDVVKALHDAILKAEEALKNSEIPSPTTASASTVSADRA